MWVAHFSLVLREVGIPEAESLCIHYLFRGAFRGLCRLLSFFRQPTHHAAQFRPYNFNRVLLLFLAQLVEVRATRIVLFNPLLSELAGLNISERFLHRLPGGVAHDLIATPQIAMLLRV